MPVAALRMVIETPGITALWLSVIVPCSVAVDCAPARPAQATSSARDKSPARRSCRLLIRPPRKQTARTSDRGAVTGEGRRGRGTEDIKKQKRPAEDPPAFAQYPNS